MLKFIVTHRKTTLASAVMLLIAANEVRAFRVYGVQGFRNIWSNPPKLGRGWTNRVKNTALSRP